MGANDRKGRLQTETVNGAVTSYTYDDNGNTKTKSGNGVSVTYSYDDANRLIDATDANGSTSYVYDADGLRVRSTYTPIGGTATTTWYVQDKAYAYAQAIEEYTQEGSEPRRLSVTTTFADDLVSQTRYDELGAPSTSYVQADGFGSTRLLTDENGAVTDAIDYDAFGNVIARSGTTDIDHLYRGEALDPNTGFYYLRARYY
ncbi:MAG: hypothetical protein KDA51_08685, partial [Planctomycetales bacterium]|nr:hypothetical protein [Planctomycetales bacterium]